MPPRLLSIIKPFYLNMKGVVQFDGTSSDAFDIRSGVKQGCVLASTLFGIFFAAVLSHAFKHYTEGIFLHTRSDGKFFCLSRMKAKTKVREALIRDMLFADDAAVVTHAEEELQHLIDSFSQACSAFCLQISLKKTNVMAHGVEHPPTIIVNKQRLGVVKEFTYLGSTVTDNLSMEAEINKRIGQAATFGKLTKRAWENSKLTEHTKVTIYHACMLITLFYVSESWTLYSRLERSLNTFHMCSLRRILGIHWNDKVTNKEVLTRAQIPSLFTLLQQRRLRWLSHVHCMPNKRIQKDLLYRELETGKRAHGRLLLRFKDTCKRDMKSIDLDLKNWEELASNSDRWRQELSNGLNRAEERLGQAAEDRQT